MGGLHGSPLRAVGGGRVAELHMLPDIGGWESCPTCSTGPLHVDRVVVSHTDDSPLIAVLHPTAGGGQAALVAASDDQISYAHNGSVGRPRQR